MIVIVERALLQIELFKQTKGGITTNRAYS